MRVLLVLLVVLGATLTGAWIGGEWMMALKAAEAIAADPRSQAEAVRELREAGRVGIRIEGLQVAAPQGAAALPWLEFWVPPQRPNEVHATLPPEARLTLAGRPVALTVEDGEAFARFAPANGFALGLGRLRAGAVTLGGAPLADRVALSARLVGFGADAPRAAGAAYEVTADVAGLSLAALTGEAAAGTASVEGGGRLWLDHAPGRGGSARPPRLVGFRADGLVLRLDELTARVWGRIVADSLGRAEGELFLDTADAAGFIARAAELGALPQGAVPFATAMLTGLAGGDMREQTGGGKGAVVPEPQPGELRIPFSFREGKAFLGPVPIGPAPGFPV